MGTILTEQCGYLETCFPQHKSSVLCSQDVVPNNDKMYSNTAAVPKPRSKLVRQDSVDDFLAEHNIPQDSIRQFMSEFALDSQRATTTTAFEGHSHELASMQTSTITSANGEIRTPMPKLKRQDSVDDFLADDFARTRSVADFIKQMDVPQQEIARAYHKVEADPPHSFKLMLTNPASARHLETKSVTVPKVQAAVRMAKLELKRRKRPATTATDSGDENREERRREQNREAQRRFRERRKYLEFEAFSHRLATSAAAAAATQQMAQFIPRFYGIM